jgi:hypothetical protein
MENNHLEEQKYLRAQKRVKAIKGFYVHLIVYIIVNLFLILLMAIPSGNWHVFFEWQAYSTAVFWGIGLLFHAFNVFGLTFLLGKSWEDKKIKEFMDKDKKEFWE